MIAGLQKCGTDVCFMQDNRNIQGDGKSQSDNNSSAGFQAVELKTMRDTRNRNQIILEGV